MLDFVATMWYYTRGLDKNPQTKQRGVYKMIDLKVRVWEFHPREEKAIRWLDERGYDVVLLKQYLSKLVFEVSKME